MNSPTPPVEDVLTPCPFCGGKDIVVEQSPHSGWFITECDAEKADGCGALVMRTTKRASIAAWNARADAKVIEALRTDLQRAREALLPFAELAGDVNMDDPLSKWLTVGHLWEARSTLNTISSGPGQ